MNRLAQLIGELSVADLRLVQKDLQAGTIDRLIIRRLAQLEERKTCVTCGRELAPNEQKYSLEFGPSDLRQKAWFDELDCLDHFLERQRSRATNTRSPSTSSSSSTTDTFGENGL